MKVSAGMSRAMNRPDRIGKVALTAHVDADLRRIVKVTAANADVTMDFLIHYGILRAMEDFNAPESERRKLLLSLATGKAGRDSSDG